MNAPRCFAATVGVLVAVNVLRSFGLLGGPLVSASVLATSVALVAWWSRASLRDLGLSRTDLVAGLRYGSAVLLLVVVVLVVAAVIPATNNFLHDSRADISGPRLIYQLAIPILLATVLPEELAFRGVLLGSALHLWTTRRAALVCSLLFGLWHIAPTLHTMADNAAIEKASTGWGGHVVVVIGAVAATSVAGLVFCWLRIRSRSLLAPVIAHFATNGVALTVAWFAVH